MEIKKIPLKHGNTQYRLCLHDTKGVYKAVFEVIFDIIIIDILTIIRINDNISISHLS